MGIVWEIIGCKETQEAEEYPIESGHDASQHSKRYPVIFAYGYRVNFTFLR
jgi:hypothetical protein